MPMREECTYYESRTYPSGDVARYCTLDLAPQAPWRCPENCSRYERILLIDGTFVKGSLAGTPPVPAAPDASEDDIVAVLDAAENIVLGAGPSILAEIEAERARRPWWRRWRRRGGGKGGGRPGLSRR